MEIKTARGTGLTLLFGLLLAAAPGMAEESCVEVEIGGEKTPTIACLNQRLQRKAAEIRPPDATAPLDASSSAVKTGGFNLPALKQQYGPNFGTSAQPYRPVQTYPSPGGAGQ